MELVIEGDLGFSITFRIVQAVVFFSSIHPNKIILDESGREAAEKSGIRKIVKSSKSQKFGWDLG